MSAADSPHYEVVAQSTRKTFIIFLRQRGGGHRILYHALTPNTVELIPVLGALFPRGGHVKHPVLTHVGWSVGEGSLG